MRVWNWFDPLFCARYFSSWVGISSFAPQYKWRVRISRHTHSKADRSVQASGQCLSGWLSGHSALFSFWAAWWPSVCHVSSKMWASNCISVTPVSAVDAFFMSNNLKLKHTVQNLTYCVIWVWDCWTKERFCVQRRCWGAYFYTKEREREKHNTR